MPWNESELCPYCGSSMPCENPQCIGPKIIDDHVFEFPVVEKRVDTYQERRLEWLKAKARIEGERAELVAHQAKFRFRRGSGMRKDYKARDAELKSQLINVLNQLAILKAERGMK